MTAELEVIWDKYKNYIIRDVHEKLHPKVQDYMLKNYFIPHRLYAQLNFQEDPAVNVEYLKYVDHILRDQCSLVVLDENNCIHAVALLKCMTKEWRTWTAFKIAFDESKFMDITELQYQVVRKYVEQNSDESPDTLSLFEYYIDDELRHDYQLLGKFFNAINETARHFKMPNVKFLALSQADQQVCNEQGYAPLSRTIYSIYTVDNRRPFALLRDIDEMEAILFVIDIDPIVPFYEMKVRGIDEVEHPKEDMIKTSVGAISLPLKSISIF